MLRQSNSRNCQTRGFEKKNAESVNSATMFPKQFNLHCLFLFVYSTGLKRSSACGYCMGLACLNSSSEEDENLEDSDDFSDADD